jgi:hypothetical protein
MTHRRRRRVLARCDVRRSRRTEDGACEGRSLGQGPQNGCLGHMQHGAAGALAEQPRHPQSIGFSPATIASRCGSRKGGSTTFSPSVAGSSSTAKPGPSVAISNSTPFGSRR